MARRFANATFVLKNADPPSETASTPAELVYRNFARAGCDLNVHNSDGSRASRGQGVTSFPRRFSSPVSSTFSPAADLSGVINRNHSDAHFFSRGPPYSDIYERFLLVVPS